MLYIYIDVHMHIQQSFLCAWLGMQYPGPSSPGPKRRLALTQVCIVPDLLGKCP